MSVVRTLSFVFFLDDRFFGDLMLDLKLPFRGNLTIHDGGTIILLCLPETHGHKTVDKKGILRYNNRVLGRYTTNIILCFPKNLQRSAISAVRFTTVDITVKYNIQTIYFFPCVHFVFCISRRPWFNGVGEGEGKLWKVMIINQGSDFLALTSTDTHRRYYIIMT